MWTERNSRVGHFLVELKKLPFNRGQLIIGAESHPIPLALPQGGGEVISRLISLVSPEGSTENSALRGFKYAATSLGSS